MSSSNQKVLICGRPDDLAQAIAAELKDGGMLVVPGADVTCSSTVKDAEQGSEKTWTEHGPLHAVVIVAGPPAYAPLSDLELASWDESVNRVLKAPFFLARSFGLRLQEVGGGALLLVLDCGMRPGADVRLPGGVVRDGFVTMTEGLAKTLAPQVHVNAVVVEPCVDAGSEEERHMAAARLVRFVVMERVPASGSVFYVRDEGRGMPVRTAED
jgi:NAD(P)-dependent dehydrogenase (short-subunit alcohol dehydrogenase family)